MNLNIAFQEAFTRAFIKHYSRMTLVLINGLERSAISNRVVHISVQLFSNEILAKKMVEEYNLLYILIVCLTNMLESILTESSLQGENSLSLLYIIPPTLYQAKSVNIKIFL